MSDKKIPYWQKLQDPRWQKKRLEVFERDCFMWRCCAASDKTLEVHHEYYVAGREPWEYPLSTFRTLCHECHIETKDISKVVTFTWEAFHALEATGELHGCSGMDSGFINNLNLFARANNWPACELLNLFADAMALGIMDHETLAQWTKARNSIFNETVKQLPAEAK